MNPPYKILPGPLVAGAMLQNPGQFKIIKKYLWANSHFEGKPRPSLVNKE